MSNRPRLALVGNCPDEGCAVTVGATHQPTCGVAICVSTGHQRALHHDDSFTPPVDLGGGLLDVHICGEDVWTGLPHGAADAADADLFVYRENGAGPWIPCDPAVPGAVPDLTRVMQTGTWDPIRQRWDIPATVVTDHA